MRHCSWGRLTTETKYLAHTNFNSNASLENIYKRAPLLLHRQLPPSSHLSSPTYPPALLHLSIQAASKRVSGICSLIIYPYHSSKLTFSLIDTYTMLFNFFTSLLALSALIIQAAALPATTPNLAVRAPLGINCRGSSECNFHGSTKGLGFRV